MELPIFSEIKNIFDRKISEPSKNYEDFYKSLVETTGPIEKKISSDLVDKNGELKSSLSVAKYLQRSWGNPLFKGHSLSQIPTCFVGRSGIIWFQPSGSKYDSGIFRLWNSESELTDDIKNASLILFWRLPLSQEEITQTITGEKLLLLDEINVYNPFDGFVEAWISAAWEQRVIVDGPGLFWTIQGAGHRRNMGRKLANPGYYRIRANHNRGDGWRPSNVTLVGDRNNSRYVGVEDGADSSWDDTLIRFFSLL